MPVKKIVQESEIMSSVRDYVANMVYVKSVALRFLWHDFKQDQPVKCVLVAKKSQRDLKAKMFI